MKNLILILISLCLFVSCGNNKKKSDNEVQVVSEQKMIALSFDDGPNTTTTVQMLDMLEKHGVKGSFYVIGKNINDFFHKAEKLIFELPYFAVWTSAVGRRIEDNSIVCMTSAFFSFCEFNTVINNKTYIGNTVKCCIFFSPRCHAF